MAHESHHISNLNVLKEDEAAHHNEQGLDEEQLRIFSNTQFYDLDMGQNTDIGTTVDELLMQQEKEIQFPHKVQPLDEAGPSSSTTTSGGAGGPRAFEFDELQQFSLAGDMPGYPYVSAGGANETTPAALHTAHRMSWYKARQHASEIPVHVPFEQVQHQPQHQIPHQIQHQPIETLHTGLQLPPPPPQQQQQQQPDVEHLTPTIRVAAEEDKRRRNTAASARFRIKKKLKEQELERNTKQMQARIDDLENKVRQLEMENKWLKNLVVERNEASDTTSIERLRSKALGSG